MTTYPAPAPTASDLEEKFLSLLADPTASLEKMAEILRALANAADPAKADACAELWQGELIANRSNDDLLALLRLRAEWRSDDKFKRTATATLEDYFRTDSLQQIFIRNAPNVSTTEALRRLTALRAMHPGAPCYDKTWGAGTIRSINEYHQQIEIDFAHKPGHRLALSHAAANLMLLPPENILALHLSDPAAAQRRIDEAPDVAVREILLTFGPFTPVRLQEWVTTHLLSEAAWKMFWDAARKKLKEDPLVSLPTRRNELIIVRAREQTTDPQWQAEFQQETDPEKIMQTTDEIRARNESLPTDIQNLLAERLGFVLSAAGKREQDRRARAWLMLEEMNIAPSEVDMTVVAAELLAPETFTTAMASIPARSRAPFCSYLLRRQPNLFHQILPEILRTADAGALHEIWRALADAGEQERAAELLRELLQAPEPSLELVAWLCRNSDICRDFNLVAPDKLAFTVLNLLENPAMSGVGRTRARNQLRDSLTDPNWMGAALNAMSEQQRRDFVLRLQTANLGADLNNATLLLLAVKLRPELEQALQGSPQPAAAPARITSQRSYHARQAQLHKLVTEEIPANSHEIGIARSYGDLRENFEYKAAKDTQGLLMRRRVELEQMLSEVRAVDFSGFPTDCGGPGTSVTLRYDDGREEKYHILGEWDHDEQLGIISNRSRLAEILHGRKAGERVEVPDGNGQMHGALVAAVGGLSDAVRDWINADPEKKQERRYV
jgi:transcription elongation GreA/GreB family factor